MRKISLTIDGRGIEVDEGRTVLQAATEAGITIPTICDHKDLSPFGACRMCIVEIEGVRGFPTSCTTPAAAGMVVRTQSDELRTLRNRTLELMLSGHPNSCLVCPHREDCEKYRPRPTKAGRTTRCGFCSNRDECNIRTLALARKLAGSRHPDALFLLQPGKKRSVHGSGLQPLHSLRALLENLREDPRRPRHQHHQPRQVGAHRDGV